MENNEELKDIICANLVKFRKANKMTQLELAEKLQYSDKNISKWERGDSLPDPIVLKQIADIYNISVNDLMQRDVDVVAKQEEVSSQGKIRHRFFNKQQLLICLLSTGIVWLVATIAFVVLNILAADLYWTTWHVFVLAIPVCAIILVVFSSIWCTNLLNGINVSLLVWSIALAFNVCVPIDNSWLIYILAIPIQILDVLWFSLRKINKNANKSIKSNSKENEIKDKDNQSLTNTHQVQQVNDEENN